MAFCGEENTVYASGIKNAVNFLVGQKKYIMHFYGCFFTCNQLCKYKSFTGYIKFI